MFLLPLAGFASALAYNTAIRPFSSPKAQKIHYAIGIGIGIVNIFLVRIINLSKFMLLFVLCIFVLPILLMRLADLLIDGPDPIKRRKKENETGKSRQNIEKLYDREAIVLRLLGYEENWGHVRFRLNGIYAAEADKPEILLKSYARPLRDENELKTLTDDFIRHIKENGFDTNQSTGERFVDLLEMTEVHHDEQGPYRAVIAFGCGKDSMGPWVKSHAEPLLSLVFKDSSNKPIAYRYFSGIGLICAPDEAPHEKNFAQYAFKDENIACQVRREGENLYIYKGKRHISDRPVYRIRKDGYSDSVWRVESFSFPHDSIFTVVEVSDLYKVYDGVRTGGEAVYTVTRTGDSFGHVYKGDHRSDGNKLYIVKPRDYDNVIYDIYNIFEHEQDGRS
jgi:hypothetical protein